MGANSSGPVNAGDYIGLVRAKRDEEKHEFDQARARAAFYLRNCRPDYIRDDQDGLLGLAAEEESEDDGHNPFDESSSSDSADGVVEAVPVPEGGAVEVPKTEEEKKTTQNNKILEDNKALLAAAAKGHKYVLQGLLAQKSLNKDYRDKHGRSALFFAAERGQPKALKTLLIKKPQIDLPNEIGWGPLHAACFHGQVQCIDFLVQDSADVNLQDLNGCTPLILAASSPKLYLTDLVSKANRKKLLPIRQQILGSEDGMPTRDEVSLQAVPPEEWWTHFPTRTEIIVMGRLLNAVPKPPLRKCAVDTSDFKKRTPLIYAARYGRTYAVSRLLAARADQMRKDVDGRTALMLAASHEHFETVELLILAMGAVNSTDNYFETPLHGALNKGDESMVNLLLKCEASVNAYDCEGRTPILLAMDQRNRRLFAQIVQRRSNLDVLDKRGWNVVIYAIETGMLREIEPLLAKLGNNANMILRNRDPEGKNAILHAIQLEDLKQAQKDVEIIVRIDPESAIYGDCNGDTALHYAAELGRLDLLRILVKDMQYADYENERGETPLHYAAHGGHLACVVALIDSRHREPLCDAGVDFTGRSLLMHACVSGQLDLVNLLLQNREGTHPFLKIPYVDVNHQDSMGVTALSVAAREGQWHLLPSLVIAGANLMAKDMDGFTALHWAATEDEALCTSCLLDLAADTNAIDARGWTALMHAVARGCDEVVRVLVDGGTDLNARNWDGDTAFQICSRRRDAPELVQITTDIITDGLLDVDKPATHSIEAKGHFVVSVLDAVDLYMEGKVGELNTYVCLQLRTQNGGCPYVAFTSCVLKEPSPSWHEVFRFDIETLDPSACLVAWVIAAPGDEAEDVITGTELGLSEDQLMQVKATQMRTGVPLMKSSPEFTTAMQKAFNRLTRRADRHEDNEVARLRKLAMAQARGCEPTMDLVLAKSKASSTVEERRWEEVSNLRLLLERSGCDIQDPLVPRTHLPLGCVVLRFRQLREAVWGTEPVEVSRTLRLNCRGNLRIELDFRPTFYKAAQDPRAGQMSTLEEEEIYCVKPLDVQDDSLDWKQAFAAGDEVSALRSGERYGATIIGKVGPDKYRLKWEKEEFGEDEKHRNDIQLIAKVIGPGDKVEAQCSRREAYCRAKIKSKVSPSRYCVEWEDKSYGKEELLREQINLIEKADAKAPDALQKQLGDFQRAEKAKGNPEQLFKRFNQVLGWSQATLETAEEEKHMLRQRRHRERQKARQKELKLRGDDRPTQKRFQDIAEIGKMAMLDAQAAYNESKREKKLHSEAMDRPVGSAPPPPPTPLTQKGLVARAKKEKTISKQDEEETLPIKWPKLRIEPWLEDMLESSKLV